MMDIDVEKLIKMIRIHGGSSTRQLLQIGEVKLPPPKILDHCKKHPNDPKNIPTEIKKNRIRRKLYTRVVMICQKKNPRRNPPGKTQKNCFKDSMKEQSIGLILVLSRLKENSIEENLSFTRGRFK